MNRPHAILFIDDEAYILKSLERLFEDEGYEILTSQTPSEALELIKNKPVTVIISDFRMPEMDGVQLLESAASLCPEAVRVMLTGYADIEAIISAINRGQVFRFITKPWNEDEFKTMVGHCIRYYEMIKENHYLSELTLKQNEELKALNSSLKASIDERTNEIHEKNRKLEQLFRALEQSFLETVKLILKVMETTNVKLSDHSRKVMAIAESLSKKLGFQGAELRNIQLAALLHDVGKIYIPQGALFKKEALLSREERETLKQHPSKGSDCLSSIERLKKVREIILYHHENVDGSGYPAGKKFEEIPFESRILAVADAYENLTSGRTAGMKEYTPVDAIKEILSLSGKTYDPRVVKALEKGI